MSNRPPLRREPIKVVAALLGLVLGTKMSFGAGEPGGGFPGRETAQRQEEFTPHVENLMNLGTGAASYALPLKVPPGRGGMEPQLSLTYSSQSKWGVTGYGWALAGLDHIGRSTKNGVPTYDGSDVFQWNGEPLLMGADGHYHTGRERFVRVDNVGGSGPGSYWIATQKSGVQYRYGYQADSRIEAVGRAGQVRVWALDEIRDRNGNSIAISYTEDPSNGDYYPLQIRYTLHDTLPVDGVRTVDFEWEGRSDVRSVYGEGALVSVDKRLARISMSVGTSLVHSYTLSYVTGSGGKSLLRAVTHCGSDGLTCLPATQFGYRAPTTGFAAVTSWGTGQGTYVSAPEHSTWGAAYVNHGILDITGDGRADDVFRNTASPNYWVRPNAGAGFGAVMSWGSGQGQYIADQLQGVGWATPYSIHELMDMDGDGRLDDVYRTGAGNYLVRRNTGAGFGAVEDWGSGQSQYIRHPVNANTWASATLVHDLIDLNGDGMPDDVYRPDAGTYRVRLNQNGSFGPLLDWGSGQGSYIRAPTELLDWGQGYIVHDLRDMNGDGLVDDVFRQGSGSYSVRLNTGRSFAPAVSWGTGQFTDLTAPVHYNSPGMKVHRLLDVNGDGLPDDVYRPSAGSYSVRLNTGSGFSPTAVSWGTGQGSYLTDPVPSSWGSAYAVHDLLDINGDQLPDDVLRDGVASYTVRTNLALAGDLLDVVTLPAGGTIRYGYAASTAFDNTDAGGLPGLPFALWVVSSVIHDDGLGTAMTRSFVYEGGYYDGIQREFRGFREVSDTDAVGARTVTRFVQSGAAWGAVAATDRYAASGDRLLAIEHSHSDVDLGNGIRWGRLDHTTTTRYDGAVEGLASRTSYSYDEYGNVATIDESGNLALSGDERRTERLYAANLGAWLLDRVKYERVTGFDSDGIWRMGRESKIYYDAQSHGTVLVGNATRTERWLDTLAGWVVTTSGHDGYGNQVWTVDENGNGGGAVNGQGHTADVTYDAFHRAVPVSVTNALGQVTTTVYDERVRPTAEIDANDQVTTSSYDALGRVVAVVRPGDSANLPTVVTTYLWDGLAPELTRVETREVSGQAGMIAKVEVNDGLGRHIQDAAEGVIAGQYIVSDTYYDEVGQIERVSVPYVSASFPGTRDPAQAGTMMVRDELGRTVAVISPDGTSVMTEHDRDLVTVTDGLGRSRMRWVNPHGHVVQVKEFQGAEFYVTQYGYNVGTGELRWIRDHAEQTTTFTYDTLGRQLSETDLDRGTWLRSYDDHGNLIDVTDANGEVTVHEYDALHRTTRTLAMDGQQYSYVYDSAGPQSFSVGRLVSIEHRAADATVLWRRNYQHDARGRVIAEDVAMDGKTWSTLRSYDASDRPVSVTYPGGEVVSSTYDSRGMMTGLVGASSYLSAATYAASGQVNTLGYGNGVSTSYDYYDTIGEIDQSSGLTLSQRLRSMQVTGPAVPGAVDMLASYEYDAVGNVARVTDVMVPSKSQSFAYDDLDRLASATGVYGTKSYQYDAIGNLTVKDGQTYSYGGGHRLAATGAISYSHDGNGNVVSRSEPAVQTFSSGSAGFAAWTDAPQGTTHTYAMGVDGTQGMAAPSLRVAGDHAPSGNGWLFGMARTVRVGADGGLAATFDLRATSSSATTTGAQLVVQNPANGQALYVEDLLPAGTLPVTTSHAFEQTLDGWFFWSSTAASHNYTLSRLSTGGNPGGTAYVSGDYTGAGAHSFGMQKQFDVAAGANLSIQLDVRAVSTLAKTTTTNATLAVLNTATGAVLATQSLVSVNALDSNWQARSLLLPSAGLGGASRVTVRIYLTDANRKNYSQRIYVDDVVVSTTGVGYQPVADTGWVQRSVVLSAAQLQNVGVVRLAIAVRDNTSGDAQQTVAIDNLALGSSVEETFVYDSLTRLIAVSGAGGSESYVYDDGGQRVKKVRGSEVTYYVGPHYEETWVGGVLDESHKHYFADDRRVATRDGEGLKYQHPDHLGSASRISDAAGVEIKAHWYDPYGADAAESGTATVKYKFTGKEHDDSGLYYYGARYYDPVLGRFLAADSVLPDPYDPQQLNRYAYVRNNPVKLVDPTGHVPVQLALGAGLWAGGMILHNERVASAVAGGINGLGSMIRANSAGSLNGIGAVMERVQTADVQVAADFMQTVGSSLTLAKVVPANLAVAAVEKGLYGATSVPAKALLSSASNGQFAPFASSKIADTVAKAGIRGLATAPLAAGAAELGGRNPTVSAAIAPIFGVGASLHITKFGFGSGSLGALTAWTSIAGAGLTASADFAKSPLIQSVVGAATQEGQSQHQVDYERTGGRFGTKPPQDNETDD
jgi:RHS repeat-associated protein